MAGPGENEEMDPQDTALNIGRLQSAVNLQDGMYARCATLAHQVSEQLAQNL